MRVVVTGAAGFIGSHLCERLVADGHAVVGVDNFDDFYDPRRKIENLARLSEAPGFSLHEVDIRSRASLDPVLAKADAVVHLAARAGVRGSFRNAGRYSDINVTGTAVVLEAASALAVPRLIFASSSSVYGEAGATPFRELDEPRVPVSPYGSTKAVGEMLCRNFASSFSFVTVLRLFTVYGPRQRPDLAVHKFADSIVNREPIPVYGTMQSYRDYTYVEDTVGAVAAALHVDQPWLVLNVGSGRPITLLQMIGTLESALGVSAQRLLLNPRPGDLFGTWADISRAEDLLGYRPRWAFEDGIEQFARWFMETQRSSGSTPLPYNGRGLRLPVGSATANNRLPSSDGESLNGGFGVHRLLPAGDLGDEAAGETPSRYLSGRAPVALAGVAAVVALLGAVAGALGLLSAIGVAVLACAACIATLLVLFRRDRHRSARDTMAEDGPGYDLKLDFVVRRELARARRSERPLAVASLSVVSDRRDRFRSRHLDEVARALAASLRQTDVIARTNEPTRLALLLSETSGEHADGLLARLESQLELGRRVNVGVASFPEDGVTWAGLKDLARERERPLGAAEAVGSSERSAK